MTKDKNYNQSRHKSSQTGSAKRLPQRSPESLLFESQHSELCYDYADLSPEIVPRVLRIKLNADLKKMEENEQGMQNDAESELQNTSARDERKEFVQATGHKENCFPLDKTLSMNDEMKLEMNGKEFLLTDKSVSTRDGSFGTQASLLFGHDLPCGYVSEPARLAFNSENRGRFHLLLDDIRPAASISDRSDEKKAKKNSRSHTRLEIVNEKTSQDSGGANRLTTNWNECRRIFSNLRQLHAFKKNAECAANSLPEYKQFNDEMDSVHAPMSTSLSCYTPPSTREMGCIPKSYAKQREEEEQEHRDLSNVAVARVRARSTTPCSGSPPPAKRCRTTLKFDDEQIKRQSPTAYGKAAEVLLPEKMIAENSFLPNITMNTTKTRWSSSTPDSPVTSILDLPAVSDSAGCNQSIQEMDPENGFSDQRLYVSFHENVEHPWFNFLKRSVIKTVFFCIMLMKQLKNSMKATYGSFQQTILVSKPSKYTQQVEELTKLVRTLRSENQRITHTLLGKVICLSDELTQVKTNNAAALDALIAELSGMREANRKLAENNEVLIHELKKLNEKPESIRKKQSAPPPPPILMQSSTPNVPPPPPPPPLPLLPSPSQSVTPMSRTGDRFIRTPSRKCLTPLLNRPPITVEDLLKVTLKKAPQNVKENRRLTVPGPKGPVVSLEMLRSVKLKSGRRRTNDHIVRSPRSARVFKTRASSSLSLSPILTGADNTLKRILKQADANRRGPRRLLSSTIHSRENDVARNRFNHSTDLKDNKSLSAIA